MTKCCQPIPAQPQAAREAALVAALKENAAAFHATHSGLATAPFKTCRDAMCESNRAALADTSATALLAQGERMRKALELIAKQSEDPGMASIARVVLSGEGGEA